MWLDKSIKVRSSLSHHKITRAPAWGIRLAEQLFATVSEPFKGKNNNPGSAACL
jgi:hypothetical protein